MKSWDCLSSERNHQTSERKKGREGEELKSSLQIHFCKTSSDRKYGCSDSSSLCTGSSLLIDSSTWSLMPVKSRCSRRTTCHTHDKTGIKMKTHSWMWEKGASTIWVYDDGIQQIKSLVHGVTWEHYMEKRKVCMAYASESERMTAKRWDRDWDKASKHECCREIPVAKCCVETKLFLRMQSETESETYNSWEFATVICSLTWLLA